MVVHDPIGWRGWYFHLLDHCQPSKRNCLEGRKEVLAAWESLPLRTGNKPGNTTSIIRDLGGFFSTHEARIQFQDNLGHTFEVLYVVSLPTGHHSSTCYWGQTTPQRCSAFLGWLFSGHVVKAGPPHSVFWRCLMVFVFFLKRWERIPLWCISSLVVNFWCWIVQLENAVLCSPMISAVCLEASTLSFQERKSLS